jgi:alpha-beta hydrolase superfamily lysophospholipase
MPPLLQTYAQDAATWREYQPYLPEAWRLEGDRLPREEYWRWRDLDVHLDRYPANPNARRAHEAASSVIVCHGGGGYGRLLAPYGVALREAGYDVVLPDFPGYGLTHIPPRAMRYELWVDAAVDLVAAEHARTGRPVALVGMSMGGMLCLHAAAKAPRGTVAALVVTTLMDPRAPATRAAVGRWPGASHLVPLLRLAGSMRLPMAWMGKLSAMSSQPAVNTLCARDPQGGGGRVPLAFLHSWLTYEPALEPAAFDRCPVLLAHPAADRWTAVPLSLAVFERLPAPKRMVLLERCEHFPLEAPGVEVLRTETLAFLAQYL